jgi:hypothetical protein
VARFRLWQALKTELRRASAKAIIVSSGYFTLLMRFVIPGLDVRAEKNMSPIAHYPTPSSLLAAA